MAVINEVLAPSVVTKIVSRIYRPGNYLSRFFGMEIGGGNVDRISGRSYSWDIFDNVRGIPTARAPATGPDTIAANPVGRQTNTFPRSYEKLPVNYELLANIRTLGKNASERDRMGATYLEKQGQVVKQRADNFREFMVASVLTVGTASFQISGDRWIPVTSLGSNPGWTIDYLVPSGNKSTAIPGLSPTSEFTNIIDAAWSVASTDIPAHLDKIDLAYQELVGGPLSLIVTDSRVWNHVLNNTKMQAQGGSVNSVFAEFERTELKNPDGSLMGIYVARLRARPWLQWLIINTGLDVGQTPAYTRWYDGTKATFFADGWQRGGYWQMQEGSEPVKENPQAPAIEQFGAHFWLREWDEPARVELHGLQNCVPELTIPKAIMIPKVA